MSSTRVQYAAYQCDLWYKHRFALVVLVLGPKLTYFDYTHKEFIMYEDIAKINRKVPVPRNIKTVLMLEAL